MSGDLVPGDIVSFGEGDEGLPGDGGPLEPGPTRGATPAHPPVCAFLSHTLDCSRQRPRYAVLT